VCHTDRPVGPEQPFFDVARVLLKGLDPDAPYVMRRDGADVLASTLARLTMLDTPDLFDGGGQCSTSFGSSGSESRSYTIWTMICLLVSRS
jgi:hypothetical protein